MPLIQIQSVSKSFGPQPVVRDLSLSIERGETLVMIGESGCGKSVTMKLLMNLIRPDSGEVYWSGQPVSELRDKQLVKERLRLGYLFQGAALFDSQTVFENVAFGLRQNRSLPELKVRQIVDDRLHDVGLDPRIVREKKPAELSGGMRKRVGLARALALDPEVMLYDEPTTGLDPIMSDVINELILKTAKRNVTSIVVTHDMHTVRKVADRVVMLYPLARMDANSPQIIFDGSAEEAFSHPDPRVWQFVHGEARERLTELGIAA
ncbi:MAG: ATP-binding cassette domain-containing protein [Planctomycetaceae bacterium]|nr:ATP-binding cassette domain-containing protein [Planctomycetaceae bacterium]